MGKELLARTGMNAIPSGDVNMTPSPNVKTAANAAAEHGK
jgi:hypothetical protein